MKLLTKVEQEIEGNKWFKTTLKIVQNEKPFSENYLKNILQEAITYYMIDAISFQMFMHLIDQISERIELQTMPELADILTQLLLLSTYNPKLETHRENIITAFYKIVSRLIN